MALILSGKYWRISEIEKKFGVPVNQIYPLLNSMKGVIKIGYTYLMPDFLMPILANKLKNKKLYTITTTARLVNCTPGFIKLLIANGLPCSIHGFDDPKINKKNVLALKKAIKEIKNIEIKTNRTELAMAIVKLTRKYISEQKGA